MLESDSPNFLSATRRARISIEPAPVRLPSGSCFESHRPIMLYARCVGRPKRIAMKLFLFSHSC